jgi:hypothetical protein
MVEQFRQFFTGEEKPYHDLVYVNENSLWSEYNIIGIGLLLIRMRRGHDTSHHDLCYFSQKQSNNFVYRMDETTAREIHNHITTSALFFITDNYEFKTSPLVDDIIDEILEAYNLQGLYAKALLVDPANPEAIMAQQLFDFNQIEQSIQIEQRMSEEVENLQVFMQDAQPIIERKDIFSSKIIETLEEVK